MKKLALLIIALFSAAALAQDLPRIAVYVTGNVGDDEKKALGTRMLASLINSKRYKGIERSNSFLMEIEKEQEKQRSGEIDDNQISALGRQFGVKFVCIADITPAFGDFQVSARIINVETAEVEFIGDASGQLKSMADLTKISEQVVKNMFSEQSKPEPKPEPAAQEPPPPPAVSQAAAEPPKTEPQPKPAPKPKENKISAGGGVLLAANSGGGIEYSHIGQKVEMPYTGGGAYLFFDAIYAEAAAGFSTGGGVWKIDGNIPIEKGIPDMPRSYVNVAVFAKYPLEAGSVKLFPLLGVDYEAAISGKIKYVDETEYAFDGGNGRYAASALSALWVKFGGGADFGLGQSLYLRAELLYGLRAANGYELEEAKTNGNKKTIPASGVTLKAGAGVKF